ncbi:MAG: sugar kinase [Chloroflexota bacterium]
MPIDLLTIGEVLVEVMRTDIDQPLNRQGPFIGPYPSGAPFIFAVQAARLNMNCVALGSVGDDAFGECLHNQLEEDGINADYIQIMSDQTTGVAFVAYNADGSRNFVFSLGAGQYLPETLLEPSLFKDLRCLHLMGSTLALSEQALATGKKALQLAKSNGAKFSFDPNLRPELMPIEKAKVVFAPFIEAADVLIPTEDELLSLTDSKTVDNAIMLLMEANPARIIVITQGKAGCTIYHKDKIEQVTGFSVKEVDPTGAGDCFDAGFLSGWLSGKSLYDSAYLANACGALAVTKQGPMAGAAKLAHVQAFMDGYDG